MKDKNNNLPDLSGLFKIDENEIPDEIIQKEPVKQQSGESILLSKEAVDTLPKPQRKVIRKDRKQYKRKQTILLARKRIAVIAAAVIALVLTISLISFFADRAKRPEITFEKVRKETVVSYAKNTGVTYSNGNSIEAVFIDNDYDVNFITTGQTVQMTTPDGLTVNGMVKEIKEEPAGSELITKYYNILTGTIPATSVYAVYILPDSTESFTQAGLAVDIQVITGTSEDTLTVPSSAIRTENGQTFVWIYSSFSKEISRQNVTVGISYDGRTEVTSGLRRSQKIVSSSSCLAEELSEGIKVRAKKG